MNAYSYWIATVCAVLLGCASTTPDLQRASSTSPTTRGPAIVSGVERSYFDDRVRAQDDFYTHVNGEWLETTKIPPDKAGYGPPYQLQDETREHLRGILEAAARDGVTVPGMETRKIGDLYASFMNEARLEALGTKALQPEFAQIDALRDKVNIPELFARLQKLGVSVPVELDVDQDARNSTEYIAYLSQGGLGLPDRDYYLDQHDSKLSAIRAKYLEHIGRMLTLAGEKPAPNTAASIIELETELAKAQWTKVENRDPVKTYNKMPITKLPELATGFDWTSYLKAAAPDGKVSQVVVSQPSYMTMLGRIVEATPLPTWKAYLKWQLLREYARYLNRPLVDERFAFYGSVLSGVPENPPRWQRGVQLVDQAMGEALGKAYVSTYFPPESKARMEDLVKNVLAAYRQSIDQLDWMGPETKKEAQAKLAKITTKIAYPNQWRDYSGLEITRDDLVGNIMRANRFEYDRNLAKLGKPIDRDEWYMTPQTVNAYYNPLMNEIVFPAAYLQPPYFDPNADDAINYGAVGSTIGHEISHAFDDSGSQYDGDGNLRDWWTKEDHEKFAAKTKALVGQYNAYSPVPGYHINGELTLGENIADNAGLAIAYKAYMLALGGKAAPTIDGFTGDQRFYISFAQADRDQTRDEQTIVDLKSDPHSPEMFRVNGSLVNQPAFYGAFGVKPDDKMYLPPAKRVIIW